MHIAQPRTWLVALVAALSLVPSASAAASADGVPAPSARASDAVVGPSHRSPLFTLETRFRRSYKGQVILDGPVARGSRLDRVEVDWGDGTRETKKLNPLVLYPTVGLMHRYPSRSTATRYAVTVTLYDVDGLATTRTADMWIWAEYKLTLRDLKFTAVTDCDFVGQGDFSIRYRFRAYQGDRVFDSAMSKVSVDLAAGESVTLDEGPLDYRLSWAPGTVIVLQLFVTEYDPNDFDAPHIASFRLFPGDVGSETARFDGRISDCAVRTTYTVARALEL